MSEGTAERRIAAFVADLRQRGVGVTTQQALALTEGLAATDGTRAREVALATLATSPDDIAAVDAALHAAPPSATPSAPARVSAPSVAGERQEPAGATPGSDESVSPVRGGFSAIEVLRQRDLARCTDEERAEIARHLEQVSLVGSARRSRRWASTRAGGSIDLRGTTRSAARGGGELLRLRHRTRRALPRRVLLLLDVSGSMAEYSRALLHLAYVGARARGHVEVFALGTRLTRLTRYLSSRDPDAAFASAVRAAPDWGGGTRLGSDLRGLLDDPTTNGLVRGSVTVVVSDGLDRGDPAELRAQMERLSRLAHRVIWVNPLRAGDGYRPSAAGMAAALPSVDAFVDGHSLAAFEQLAAMVADERGGDRR